MINNGEKQFYNYTVIAQLLLLSSLAVYSKQIPYSKLSMQKYFSKTSESKVPIKN